MSKMIRLADGAAYIDPDGVAFIAEDGLGGVNIVMKDTHGSAKFHFSDDTGDNAYNHIFGAKKVKDPMPFVHTLLPQFRYPDETAAKHFAEDDYEFKPRPEFKQKRKHY